MLEIYKRLEELGFNQEYVKEFLLPDWWCEDCEADPKVVIEAAINVARKTWVIREAVSQHVLTAG